MTVTNYLGNPKLKSIGVAVDFTKEQIEEYLRCKKDPIYFIRKYVKIVHVDRGLIPFELFDFQRDMVKAFNERRFVICKTPRQVGKSTTCVSYILWYILFNDDKNVAILANKAITSREILSRLQLAYENLPMWLQQGVAVWNKGNIELENGSKVLATSTSASAIRGFAVNILMLDEFAHVGNNIADDFFTSVYPTITSGTSTKVFVISTPNGMNHYYKMWREAEAKLNDYFPIDIHWSMVPGRDKKWAETTKRNMGEEKFNQEMEAEFLGSQHTLLNSQDIRNMMPTQPVHIDKESKGFVCFELPQPDHVYVMTVDVARGKGLDYSTAQIIDITNYPFRQVARYRNNDITSLVLPLVLFKIGRMYNFAECLIETNDNGEQVANILHYDLEYPNVTWIKGDIGVRTLKNNRYQGCSNFKQLVEDNQIIIVDIETIQECSTFILKGKKYQADEGCHDDLVMGMIIFSWFTTQDYFKDLTNKDIRQKIQKEKEKAIEESMLPFGFLTDGTEFDMESGGWIDIGDI